jgi:hypothetical protein
LINEEDLIMNRNERMQKIVENEPIFINTFNNSKNAYAILQLPIEALYKFRDYEDITEYLKIEPARDDYNVIYAKELNAIKGTTDKTVNAVLENIFMMYNTGNRPTDYYGTSLSVSDVIMLKIDNKVTAYYVDSFGFKKLENFEF